MFTKSNFAVGSLAAVLFVFVANPAAAQISLGTAQSFGVLGGSAVTLAAVVQGSGCALPGAQCLPRDPCHPTPTDPEGPYYREGAPDREVLAQAGHLEERSFRGAYHACAASAATC